MRDAVRLPLVASGGVTTADDVAALGRSRRRRLHHRPRACTKERITLPAALAAAAAGLIRNCKEHGRYEIPLRPMAVDVSEPA